MRRIGCSGIILVSILNIIIGSWSIDEILSWFGKDIPWIADAIIGLFTAELSIPVAIVGKILRAFGVF